MDLAQGLYREKKTIRNYSLFQLSPILIPFPSHQFTYIKESINKSYSSGSLNKRIVLLYITYLFIIKGTIYYTISSKSIPFIHHITSSMTMQMICMVKWAAPDSDPSSQVSDHTRQDAATRRRDATKVSNVGV